MSPVLVTFDPLRGPGHGGTRKPGVRCAHTPAKHGWTPSGPDWPRVSRSARPPPSIPHTFLLYGCAACPSMGGHRHPGTGMSPVFVTFDPSGGPGHGEPGNRGFATLTPRLSMVGPLRGPTGLGYRVQRIRLLPFPMTLYYTEASAKLKNAWLYIKKIRAEKRTFAEVSYNTRRLVKSSLSPRQLAPDFLSTRVGCLAPYHPQDARPRRGRTMLSPG